MTQKDYILILDFSCIIFMIIPAVAVIFNMIQNIKKRQLSYEDLVMFLMTIFWSMYVVLTLEGDYKYLDGMCDPRFVDVLVHKKVWLTLVCFFNMLRIFGLFKFSLMKKK